MPIKVPDNLPAKAILLGEHIFAMDESRAFRQDIRPLKIAILNLMPIKQTTEVQLLRMLGNTSLQVDVTLLHMESHVSKNTPQEYLTAFYRVFSEVRHDRFDGMIITGAPVESFPFEQVSYWQELTEIMTWTKTHVTSTFHICWGAQAALYFHYGIPKHDLPRKMFGVFPHHKTRADVKILRGFDDVFWMPHSRYTEVRRADIERVDALEVLAESDEAGVNISATRDGRNIFVMGHSEYDPLTLQEEYERDRAKGVLTDMPRHYDPARVNWRAHGGHLYSNWLNYYVYQETPYELF